MLKQNRSLHCNNNNKYLGRLKLIIIIGSVFGKLCTFFWIQTNTWSNSCQILRVQSRQPKSNKCGPVKSLVGPKTKVRQRKDMSFGPTFGSQRLVRCDFFLQLLRPSTRYFCSSSYHHILYIYIFCHKKHIYKFYILVHFFIPKILNLNILVR